MQSRACAVLSNGKYIFALPGSSGGVTDAWDGILKYQLDINHKPCNFVELVSKIERKIIFMKINAVRAMLIVSLVIILLYILGLFLPIIKNTKNSKIY